MCGVCPPKACLYHACVTCPVILTNAGGPCKPHEFSPLCGKAHVINHAAESVRAALAAIGLDIVTVNESECFGYIIHERAAESYIELGVE